MRTIRIYSLNSFHIRHAALKIEQWCWRRLLRVPWTAMRFNQFILKEVSPEYSLEGLMVKLKLQSFGHLMQRTDSLEKTLMLGRLKAGGEEKDRGWDLWMVSPTRWTWVWVSCRSWRWTGKPCVLQSLGSQCVRHNWATELNWTELPGTDVKMGASKVHIYSTSGIINDNLESRLFFHYGKNAL